MVEPLSPMALHDAQAAGSYGCSAVRLFGCSAVRLFGCSAVRLFGCSARWLRWLQAPIDWGQSIYHNDAQAAAFYGCSAVRLARCGGFKRRSIGDNRSTMMRVRTNQALAKRSFRADRLPYGL